MIKKTSEEQVIAAALKRHLTKEQYENFAENCHIDAMEKIDQLAEDVHVGRKVDVEAVNFEIDTLAELAEEMEDLSDEQYLKEKAEKTRNTTMVPPGY